MRCRVVLVARIYNCRAQHDLIFERKNVFRPPMLLGSRYSGFKATGARLRILVRLAQRGIEIAEADSLAVRVG